MLQLIVTVIVLQTATWALPIYKSTIRARQTRILATSATYFEKGRMNLDLVESESVTEPVQPLEHFKALKTLDVSNADNFWEEILPSVKKQRTSAVQDKDMNKRIKVEEHYNELMKIGFDRRYTNQKFDTSPLSSAAQVAASQFELGRSKEEQLADLKRKRLLQRSGVMKVVPQGLHKYVDYFNSLYKQPKKKEVAKNLLIGSFFAFIVWANRAARSSFLYFTVGMMVLMSSLLTRNMPKVVVPLGMPKGKIANWSSNSFKTAVAITAMIGGSTAVFMTALLSLLPIPATIKTKASLMASLLSSAYFTSFYEVFEEKSKNGWRWEKAQEGILSKEEEAKLEKEVYRSSKLYDLYDYNYDPQIDDYPPQPKYIDEVDGNPVDLGGGSGQLDEQDSREHFEQWKLERREARRPPIVDAPSDAKWIGGKPGLYVKNIPTWLNNAYKQNVLKANRWRDKPQKFKKDTKEFEAIPGPIGFRDKRPEWLEIFGPGVWEEKITASRRAARAFGSYRKTMWKIDKKVVLQPCDGADPKDAKKKK